MLLARLGYARATCFAQDCHHVLFCESTLLSSAPLARGAIFLHVNVSEKPGRLILHPESPGQLQV